MICHHKRLSNALPIYITTRGFLLQNLRYGHGRRHNNRDSSDDEMADNIYNIHGKPGDQRDHIHLLKSRGQHLLTNPRVLNSIVQKSNIKPTDTVLEIGPGTGNLTLKLLEAAKRVIAIEIDTRMVGILQKRAMEQGVEDRLTIICNDALKTEFPPFDLVVANIPYGISSPLVAKLVFGRNTYRSATLLLQKEFARRLLASPGDSEFNRLAVNVKLVAEVDFVMDVSKRDFVPCPKVDSSVVKIQPKEEVPDVDLEEWWAFTRTCFSKKNKTLGATFKQKRKLQELMKLARVDSIGEETDLSPCPSGSGEVGGQAGMNDEQGCIRFADSGGKVGLFREKLISVLRSGGFEDKRPSKLSNDELLRLLSSFNQAGVYFYDQANPRDSTSIAFTDTCSTL